MSRKKDTRKITIMNPLPLKRLNSSQMAYDALVAIIFLFFRESNAF